MTSREPCLCGGWLTSDEKAGAIRRAVELHQRTPQHHAWSVRMYGRAWYGPPPTPVRFPIPVDVSRNGPVMGSLRRVEP